LLPRWRGAAPIQRALLAGDAETGVCIMQMEAGLDTGPVLLRGALPIAATDTTASLHDRLAELGARLCVEALGQLPLPAEPQPGEGVTYAHKIDKAESTIDWNQPAEVIARRVRAFDPFPGAATTLGAEAIKVWSCEIDSCSRTLDAACGQILSIDADGIGVACGAGSLLRLTVLQRAGGKRLPAADFLRGFPLAPGMVLGAAP
ncbi:MAG: methionyl-tRNA formyltransferase, partial [Acidovorax sp.]|nr:methionyl-tRNA formyltransferase [Acidovorax sp.]